MLCQSFGLTVILYFCQNWLNNHETKKPENVTKQAARSEERISDAPNIQFGSFFFLFLPHSSRSAAGSNR